MYLNRRTFSAVEDFERFLPGECFGFLEIGFLENVLENLVKIHNGKAAQCRQKVCSSKRPPKLEPRSVRANEVFENLACRISPRITENWSSQKCSRKECSSKRPHSKEQNERGIFLEQPFGRNCAAP